jgi:hypothetical protein
LTRKAAGSAGSFRVTVKATGGGVTQSVQVAVRLR